VGLIRFRKHTTNPVSNEENDVMNDTPGTTLFYDSDEGDCAYIMTNPSIGFLITAESADDVVELGWMSKETALEFAANIVKFVEGEMPVNEEPEEEDTVIVVSRYSAQCNCNSPVACCAGELVDIEKFCPGDTYHVVPFRVVTKDTVKSLADAESMRDQLQEQVDAIDAKIKGFRGC